MNDFPSHSEFASELMCTKQAARYLNVSRFFLERDRTKKHDRRIPYVCLGAKLVRYRRSDLDAWVAQQTITPPTPDYTN